MPIPPTSGPARSSGRNSASTATASKAYPGKAPKLKPSKYKPDFVYRRVTDGFRAMPPWVDVYSDEERMQIVSYVLSKGFTP